MTAMELKEVIYKALDNAKSINVKIVVNGCTISENESITGCTGMCYSKALMLSNQNIIHYTDKITRTEIDYNKVTLYIEL